MGGSSRGNSSPPPPPPKPPEAQGVSGMGVAGQGRGGAGGTDIFGRREMADLRSRRRGRAANILTMMGGQPATTGGTGVRTLLGGGNGGSNP